MLHISGGKKLQNKPKKELSSSENSYITFPYLIQIRGNIINFEYTLIRSEFNDLTCALVEMTFIPVQNVLMDVGIAVSELSKDY